MSSETGKTDRTEECAAFFRSRSGYDRCFAEFRRKWEAFGRTAGTIILEGASEEERRAVGGILGKTIPEGEVRFAFSVFEKCLQKTRFAPVEMKPLLEAYFGQELLTKQERSREEKRKEDAFFAGICAPLLEAYGPDSRAVQWFSCMAEEKRWGYALLMREYRRDLEGATRAEELARQGGAALERLASGDGAIPLAVLAAEISGNPHCFDRGETAGQLLIQGLAWHYGDAVPRDAHGWRKLMMRAGVIPDTVSSLLHVYGIHIETPRGLHPAYEAYCACREPGVVTLENLRNASSASACGGRAYIVENEMVFSYLLEHVRERDRDVTLLCTSGRVRSAAHVLIGLLLKAGCRILYSGDMDPEGLDIADGLWRRYGDGVEIWRMSPEDYWKSLSTETVSERRLAILAHIRHGVLGRTAECLRAERLASYQENLLEDLLMDLLGDGTAATGSPD